MSHSRAPSLIPGKKKGAITHPPDMSDDDNLRICSPRRRRPACSEKIVEGTCLLQKEVRDIAKWYNDKISNSDPKKSKSKSSGPTDAWLSLRMNPNDLLRELHSRLGTKRGEEYLWINCGIVPSSSEIGKHLKDAFRPMMPRSWIANDRMWLSNFDIEKVMRQYEDAFPEFWMVGVFPMDFAHVLDDGGCVSMEMCGLNAETMLKNKKTHAGIVLNLDKHVQTGSHWVACYIDISPDSPNYGFFYYDSVAKPPPLEVRSFAQSILEDVHKIRGSDSDESGKKQFDVRFNRNRRQFKNTECGVFTMFFLVCCVYRELDFDTICEEMGNDDDLHTLRSVFFRPPSKSCDTVRKP